MTDSAQGGENGHAGNSPSLKRQKSRRIQRFDSILAAERIDKQALADLAWSGVPEGLSRSEVWQLLLDYRPLTRDTCTDVLRSKRQEYRNLREQYYESSASVARQRAGEAPPEQLSEEDVLFKQIRKDLPRTQARFDGTIDLRVAEQAVRSPQLQSLMERVLFIWGAQKPASGYVQGIDGILLLLLLIFLADRGGNSTGHVNLTLIEELGDEQLSEVEADTYWCMKKILSLMSDHHADGFPGIQRMTSSLMELVWRIDEKLAGHLDTEGIDLLEAGVRWIGCLMVRELPVSACARLWDALIAESAQQPVDKGGEGFETLLLYFCVSFLARSSVRLMDMDFEGMTIYMKQAAPADVVGEDAVELLLGEAFVLKSLFQQAQSHFRK